MLEREYQDVKYIRELQEYWDTYMYAVINEIYVGIGIQLGLSESQAYKLAQNNPNLLEKAGFFKSIFDKFKSIFKYKVPKFRPKQNIYGKGKPMTPEQWDIFNASIDKYWSNNTEPVADDITIKAHMLGRDTTAFREKKKPYRNKSLYQVVEDQYKGDMPDNIAGAYRDYDFKNSEKLALNKSFGDIAMYVKQTNNELTEAIRQQIQSGLDNNKSPIKVASDLYWEVEKNEELVNKYTAEHLRKNWHRIAQTEMASVYEAGILAPYEAEAMESMKDPGKAVYFVFTGGSCKWCQAHQGVLTRLVPLSVVTNTRNDSLKTMGIKDENTDVALWSGKSNVSFKETKHIHEWRVVAPAHPNNVATMQPIDLESEWYNPKTGDVEKRQKKQKFIPKQVDYTFKSKEEKEFRKPTEIGSGLVRYNNNIYESVAPNSYTKKLELWQKDPQLPIPVATDSTRYDKIFGQAERNR